MKDTTGSSASDKSLFRALHPFALVFVGGAAGTALRYALGALLPHVDAAQFPWVTFAVNVVGSGLLGVLVGALSRPLTGAPTELATNLRLLLGTGLLGGFTTYSTFTLQSAQMLVSGSFPLMAVYALGSVALGLGAALGGLVLGRGRPS